MQYGGLAHYLNLTEILLFFNKTTMLQYGYNVIRHLKELAKSCDLTHN
jgi:hypothetical protein